MDHTDSLSKEEWEKRLEAMRSGLRTATAWLAASGVIAFGIPEYLCRQDYDAKLLRRFELAAAPFVLITALRVGRKWLAYRAEKEAFRERRNGTL